MLESVVVKQLTTKQELEQVFTLEQEIWQQAYEPMHTALEQASSSALLIGAYLQDQLIGFNYSEGKDTELLYSYLLAIKREYREKGVGELIKLKQQELAEELGYSKCKWKFEPLDSYTAHLYFTKLRGYSDTYLNDHPTEIGDALVEPVDRLEVELNVADHDYLRWDAKSADLREDASDIVNVTINAAGLPTLNAFDATASYLKDAYTLPIPTSLRKLALEDAALAQEWRYKTREIFNTLFAQRYVVLQLTLVNDEICRYLFVKRNLFAL